MSCSLQATTQWIRQVRPHFLSLCLYEMDFVAVYDEMPDANLSGCMRNVCAMRALQTPLRRCWGRVTWTWRTATGGTAGARAQRRRPRRRMRSMSRRPR